MNEKQKRSGNNGRKSTNSDKIRGGVQGVTRGAKESLEKSADSGTKLIQTLYQQGVRNNSYGTDGQRSNHSTSIPVSSSRADTSANTTSRDSQPAGGGRRGGDRGDESISLNDVNGLLQAVQEALNDQRTGQWRNPHYRSPMLSPIVEQMRSRLVTMNSILLPPLIKSQLGQILLPMKAEADKYGDPYFDMAMEDLDQGRVDRLDKLLWLSGVNQVRLRISQEEMFVNVNDYVKKHYASDPTNPQDPTFFLPSEDEIQLQETWARVHDLVDAGLAMIRETVKFKVAGDTHNLTILTITSVPLATPPSSILEINQ